MKRVIDVKTDAIKLEERFSDDELNAMFTVNGRKVRAKRAKGPRRGFRKALQREDHLIDGVSVHPPGSKQRVDDMRAFMDIARLMDEPPSMFDC